MAHNLPSRGGLSASGFRNEKTITSNKVRSRSHSRTRDSLSDEDSDSNSTKKPRFSLIDNGHKLQVQNQQQSEQESLSTQGQDIDMTLAPVNNGNKSDNDSSVNNGNKSLIKVNESNENPKENENNLIPIYPKFFGPAHSGPFKIFIERKNSPASVQNERRPKLDPVEIAKIIIPIFNDSIELINTAVYNKAKVVFNNKDHANELLNHNILSENNLNAYLPNSLVSKQFIIKGITTNLTEKELLNDIELYCPFYTGKMRILHIRRFYSKIFDKKKRTY